jgi:transposase
VADQYTETERQAALELAANTSIKAAAEHLGISRKTIYAWIDKYPKLWSELQADPKHGKRKIAERLEVLADRYTAAEHDLLDQIEVGTIQAKDAKEAAALLKAFGSSRQAAVAGSRTISGEPETVQHNINFPQLEQAMQAILAQAPPPPPLPVPNEAENVDALPTDTGA